MFGVQRCIEGALGYQGRNYGRISYVDGNWYDNVQRSYSYELHNTCLNHYDRL